MDLLDLEYAINIPPLISDELAASLAVDTPPLLMPTADLRAKILERLRDQQLPFQSSKDDDLFLPLGRRFERLVERALAMGYPADILKANVQLSAKPTPGELDFLLLSARRILHVEVAVKFYLYIPPGGALVPDLSCFYGTHKKDRFDVKLRKLFHRQLRHEVPDMFAAPRGETLPVRRALWLCGRMFYPWEIYQNGGATSLELGLNPGHHQGWYLTFDRLQREMAHTIFVRLSKPQWIQPWSSVRLSEAAKSPCRAKDFGDISEPRALVRLAATGEEHDRGFVVPNDWPLPVGG